MNYFFIHFFWCLITKLLDVILGKILESATKNIPLKKGTTNIRMESFKMVNLISRRVLMLEAGFSIIFI